MTVKYIKGIVQTSNPLSLDTKAKRENSKHTEKDPKNDEFLVCVGGI